MSLIGEDETARYLNELRKTASPTTVRRKLSAFKQYAKSQGIHLFLSEYVAPKPARPQPHPIPEGMSGVDLLVAVCEDMQEVALIVLTFMCGMRISEARRVKPEDINQATQVVHVVGKGDKGRNIPLSERAMLLLNKRIDEIPENDHDTTLVDMIDRTARRRFTKIGQRAGLERQIKSHDGRHTVATDMMRRGVPMRVVQEFLGHASITQTETYTGVEMDDMRKAVFY